MHVPVESSSLIYYRLIRDLVVFYVDSLMGSEVLQADQMF